MLGTVCFILTVTAILSADADEKKYKRRIVQSNATARGFGNNAAWYDPNFSAVDNLNLIVTGYNLDLGNPVPTEGKRDNGFRNRIFFTMYKTPEDTYVLYDGIEARDDRACSVVETTSFISTVKTLTDYVKNKVSYDAKLQVGLEREVTVSAGVEKGPVSGGVESKQTVPPILKREFGMTADGEHNKMFFENEQGVLSITEAECALTTITINKDDPPPFTDGFVNRIKSLQKKLTADKDTQTDAVNSFFTDYGTHYIAKVTMGARLTVNRKISKKEYEDKEDKKLKTCSKESFQTHMFQTTMGTESNECKTKESYSSEKVEEEYTRDFLTSYGSLPAKNFQEWKQQDFTKPMPLKMQLSPILNLFTETWFGTEKIEDEEYKAKIRGIQYGELAKMMYPVYHQYCGKGDCSELNKGCGWSDDCDRRDEMCIDNPTNKKGYECCKRLCYDNPCQHGGVCVDCKPDNVYRSSVSNKGNCMYECTCTDDFFGKHCEHPTLDNDILKEEMKTIMAKNYYNTNHKLVNKLAKDLTDKYTGHTFSVVCYGPITTGRHHTGKGNFQINRYKWMNCFAGYSEKGDPTIKDISLKSIEKTVRTAIFKKGCNADLLIGKAWTALTNEVLPKAMFVCQPNPCKGVSDHVKELGEREPDGKCIEIRTSCSDKWDSYVVILM